MYFPIFNNLLIYIFPSLSDNTGRTLLFNGMDDHKVPSTSKVLLDGDLFRVAGRAIGHSFINGGPLFTGLSPCMLQLLVGSNEEPACFELTDCPDTVVVDVVSLVSSGILSCSTLQHLNGLF